MKKERIGVLVFPKGDNTAGMYCVSPTNQTDDG